MKKIFATSSLVGILLFPINKTAISYGQTGNATDVGTDKVRFVAAGIADALQKLKHVHATVDKSSIVPGEVVDYLNSRDVNAAKKKGNVDNVSHDYAEWTIDTDKMRLEVYSDPEQGNPSVFLLRDMLILNAGKITDLQTYQKRDASANKAATQYSTGFIDYASNLVRNGIWKSYNYMDPRFYAYTANGIPLNELFSTGKSITYIGDSQLYNSKCVKIRHSPAKDWSEIYWIDVEHDFLVRRVEYRLSANENTDLVKLVDIPRLVQNSGIWFPESIVDTDYWGPKRVEMVDKLRISHFDASFVDKGTTFNMIWPLGTSIENKILQKDFIVAAVSPEDMLELAKIKYKKEKEILGSAVPNSTNPTKEKGALDSAVPPPTNPNPAKEKVNP